VRRFLSFISIIILAATLSCSKQSDPSSLAFVSLTVGGVALGVVTQPNIPSNATIVACMNSDINPASVNSNSIKLVRRFDTVNVDLTITVAGSTISIVPKTNLGNGIYYDLTFSNIIATDGTSMIYIWRAFSTIGAFGPPGLVAYWNFNGNTYDQQGNYTVNSVTDLNYAPSFRRSLGQCAAFNGTSTLIEVSNGDKLVNTSDFSVSFWVKANSLYQLDSLGKRKGQMVFGVGDAKGFEFEIASDYSSCKLVSSFALPDGTTISEELAFAGDGKTWSNGGLPGWTYCMDLSPYGGFEAMVKDQWVFVCCTYKSATKISTMYLNGLRMKEQDFNKWPAGDPARNITGMKYGGTAPARENLLAVGFFHSAMSTEFSGTSWGNYYSPYANHFRGWLDELRVFQTALTTSEVVEMYYQTMP